MGRQEVFHSLKEVFPQVDIRILRAVSMEHQNDAEAAVDFVLAEVLPSLTLQRGSPSMSSTFRSHSDGISASPEDELSNQGSSRLNDKEENGGLITHRLRKVSKPCLSADDACKLSEQGLPSNYLSSSEETTNSSLQSEQKLAECCEAQTYKVDSAYAAFCVRAPSLDESVVPGSSSNDMYGDAKDYTSFVSGGSTSLENHLFGLYQHSPTSPKFTKSEDVSFRIGSHMLPENQVSCDSIDAASVSTIQQLPQLRNPELVERGLPEQDVGTSDHIFEEKCQSPSENDAEHLGIHCDIVNPDDIHYPSTITTRSGQAVSIDVLEEFINDAKNNKRILLSAMESVVSLVKNAEQHETEALQAKDDAAEAGLDILNKVEDLKQMLIVSKESNYMQSGDVYGENSILATEARELQSRLLNLAYERDRALSVIEEMRRTLEDRIATAVAEKAVAEKEKSGKEENALKMLREQEIIIDKVAQESRNLQEAANENQKLREFLLDRGRIVDILQGEIAVVCEDVMSLKERIDGRIPSGKFMQSSRISLSSSFASNHSANMDNTTKPIESSDCFKVLEAIGQTPHASGMSAFGSVDHKIVSDDEWDLFDAAAELQPELSPN